MAAAALSDKSNAAHMSPHHERAVGCAPPAEQPALDEPAARTNGAPIEAEPEPGAAEEAEAAAVPATEAEEAVVVNAVHAHSEFWLPALQLCAAELGWRVDTEGTAPSPAMVYLPPGAGRFAFMQAPMAQRFPGLRFAARKVALGRVFGWVQALAPGALPFSPQTWLLPDGLAELEAIAAEEPAPWLILKPDAGCRGRGIQLCNGVEATRTAWQAMDPLVAAGKKEPAAPEPEPEPEPECEAEPEEDTPPPPAVVQRYIARPWLWDGAKWDLRIYVLISSVSPTLQAFVAPTALARRCTMPYETPTAANAGCDRMHLSNTSVNTPEESSKEGQEDEEAEEGDGDAECKRTLAQAWAQLEAGGVDTSRLWADIRDNVVSRTLACMLPALALAYEHSYPPPRTRGGAAPPPPEQRCFQVPSRLAVSRAVFARTSAKLQFTDALFCWRRV